MSTINNTRSVKFDVTSAIMICYMIYMHITQWANYRDVPLSVILHNMFYFFMAFFFIRGGYFYKNNPVKDVISKGARRLVVPFAVFSFAGILLDFIHNIIVENVSWRTILLDPCHGLIFNGAVGGNLALWFLPTFWGVRVIFTLAFKKMKIEYIIIFCGVISYLMFLAHQLNIRNIPLYIYNIPLGTTFFAIGYKLRTISESTAMLISAILLLLSNFAFGVSYVDFRTNSLIEGYYMHFILASVAGVIMTNYVIQLIIERFRFLHKYIIFIARMGSDSMNFYVTHWLVIYSVSIVYKDLLHGKSNDIFFWLLIAANISILPFINRILKKEKYKFLVGG